MTATIIKSVSYHRLMDNYYNELAEGYDELHGEEQSKKFEILQKHIDFKPEALVLDVGCGTGLSSEHVQSRIVGSDPAVKLLTQARGRLLHLTLCRAEQLPFKSNTFDYVIAMTAVHNFKNLESGLTEIARVCKNTAVISVLRRSPKYEQIMASIKNIYNSWQTQRLETDKFDDIFILTRT
ncbi:MAG: methyltransferase domain-containing protein [Thermoplasmata archaeon]|nr:MAG: methyltransferase domain-containing protein [Thermoplasmata archaeon]